MKINILIFFLTISMSMILYANPKPHKCPYPSSIISKKNAFHNDQIESHPGYYILKKPAQQYDTKFAWDYLLFIKGLLSEHEVLEKANGIKNLYFVGGPKNDHGDYVCGYYTEDRNVILHLIYAVD